jgi:MinD-like ATPase involved in chromosome partitioning or flagellar assembly
MDTAPLGRILTFYSYKGGTGRSMALANIAWVLACAGRRVLAIDWDLEAPGLHRYFRPFLIDEEVTATDGLMDLIDRYANQAIRPVGEEEKPDPAWYLPFADISDYIVSINFPHFGAGGKIDLLPAGRQGEPYALAVSTFNWQNLYDRLGGGAFFEAVKQGVRAEYDYVLIDSRTGVSDTSGICSVQMPDTLVVCFTYNNQSIKGASAVARSALDKHKKLVEEKLALHRTGQAPSASSLGDTTRPFRIFPVPMRVDDGESDRLAIRQAFARDAFADLVDHIGADGLSEYWKNVEVPQTVFYSYEEVLAPFKDDAHDPKTVLASLLRLTRYVSDQDVADFRMPIAPARRQFFLEAFAETPRARTAALLSESQRETEEQALVRNAEEAFASMTDAGQAAALRALGRLVRIGREEEGGGYSAIRASLADLSSAERTAIEKLASYHVVTLSSDARQSTRPAGSRDQTVSLSDTRLLTSWRTLRKWLEEHRTFLVWRQQLRNYLSDWERSGQDRGALLSGRLLHEADLALVRRSADLNEAETRYIEASRRANERGDVVTRATSAPAAVLPALWPWRTALWAMAALVVFGLIGWLATFVGQPGSSGQDPGQTTPGNPSLQLQTPRFTGLSSDEARRTADAIGLKLEMTDGSSPTVSPYLEGLVSAQTPAEKTTIARGGIVRLTVETVPTITPTLARLTLTAALEALTKERLKLGNTEQRYVSDAPIGTVISQTPSAGTRVGAGTAVNVVVARTPQLNDFRIGVYFVEASSPSKTLADRVVAFILKSGGNSTPSPQKAGYFTGSRRPAQHEIRYGTPAEKQVADDLQRSLSEAGGFPPFMPRRVQQRSEGFISVFIADPAGDSASGDMKLTIVGRPYEEVEVWYRGDRDTGEAPLVHTGKLAKDGRLTITVPRAYLVVGKPGRRSGVPLDLHNEKSSTFTYPLPQAAAK